MVTSTLQKRWILWVLVSSLIFVVGFIYFVFRAQDQEVIESPVYEPEEEVVPAIDSQIIGQSVYGKDIVVHTFGNGDKNILFVGGIHGGYEWNSVVLAERMIGYFSSNLEVIPDNVTVSIIPVLNPDGLALVTGGVINNLQLEDVTNWSADGTGRFNANGIDLNRNFACKWQPQASWRGKSISAGSEAFSEPEAQALRDHVLKTKPEAVIFWHSIAGNVYGSECEDGILPLTLKIMNSYAEAGDYGAVPAFDAYPVTGDAEGWLASIGIPAITVELATRESIEWEQNLSGTTAILNLLSSEI